MTQRHIEILQNLNTIFQNGQNFFLYLHYSNIHTAIKNEVLNVYGNFSEEFFQNKSSNEIRYANLFKKAEIYLESLLEEISRLSLDDNSIILIMSDHGISVGEKIGERAYGAFCYDYTLRTFSYFLIPNYKSKEITQQIRTIDLMPTILDYLEIIPDNNYSNLDGMSLLPLIKDESLPEPYAFSETGNPLHEKAPPKEPNVKSIRTSKWKLIFNEHNNSKELYNLESDPSENQNLIGTGEDIEKVLWEELTQLINKND